MNLSLISDECDIESRPRRFILPNFHDIGAVPVSIIACVSIICFTISGVASRGNEIMSRKDTYLEYSRPEYGAIRVLRVKNCMK